MFSHDREKLTKLSKMQFKELSTDVYDEMGRRVECIGKPAVEQTPFLAVRDDFHPKRNQTRQKLATLPETRYRDLASDVFFELCRRYPAQKNAVFEIPRKQVKGQGVSDAAAALGAAAAAAAAAAASSSQVKGSAPLSPTALSKAPLPSPIALPSTIFSSVPAPVQTTTAPARELKQAPEKPPKLAQPGEGERNKLNFRGSFIYGLFLFFSFLTQ